MYYIIAGFRLTVNTGTSPWWLCGSGRGDVDSVTPDSRKKTPLKISSLVNSFFKAPFSVKY